MTTRPKGNKTALQSHRDATHAKTRQELELALARLRNGNPRKVPKGAAITAMSVATEAGVDRTTLYRFHEPVLTQIRKMADKEPRQQLEAKRTELSVTRSKAKEYRGMLEAAQEEMKAWARQNYALSHRIEELEGQLRVRDETIVNLRQQVNVKPMVVAFRR